VLVGRAVFSVDHKSNYETWCPIFRCAAFGRIDASAVDINKKKPSISFRTRFDLRRRAQPDKPPQHNSHPQGCDPRLQARIAVLPGITRAQINRMLDKEVPKVHVWTPTHVKAEKCLRGVKIGRFACGRTLTSPKTGPEPNRTGFSINAFREATRARGCEILFQHPILLSFELAPP